MLAKLLLMHESREVTPIDEFAATMYGESNTGYYAMLADQIEYDYRKRGQMGAGESYKMMDTFGQVYGAVSQSWNIPSTGGAAASGNASTGLGGNAVIVVGCALVLLLLLMPSSDGKKRKGK